MAASRRSSARAYAAYANVTMDENKMETVFVLLYTSLCKILLDISNVFPNILITKNVLNSLIFPLRSEIPLNLILLEDITNLKVILSFTAILLYRFQ